jgi:hypothetical protein
MSSEPAFASVSLQYFSLPKDGSKPWQNINGEPKTGERRRNWEQFPHAREIENIRGRESESTLDKNGFQFFRHAAKHTFFATDDEIRGEYYPESAELIKDLTGASRVVFFDHSAPLSLHLLTSRGSS